MNKSVSIFARALVFLLVSGLILGGAGMLGYRAGITRGIAQAPQVAAAIEKSAENGQVVPPMYGHGYGYGYGYPQGMYGFGYPHHFNPFGAICGSILLIFLLFGFMKMFVFRGMRHSWRHHGPWKKDWEGGAPPMFDEWHKRAHGEKPAETDAEKKE
ncbi:hypothetical protein MASR2M66_21620 [Chloroflexota bacterium]